MKIAEKKSAKGLKDGSIDSIVDAISDLSLIHISEPTRPY